MPAKLLAESSWAEDAGFFTTPYPTNLKRITALLLGEFRNEIKRAGYSYDLELSQGGFIPGGWSSAGILIDNSLQESRSLDYFSRYFGFKETHCETSCRNLLSQEFTDPNGNGSFRYNGLDRREIYFQKDTGFVYITTGQTMWVKGHGPGSAKPVVTALPTSPIKNYNSKPMELFGAQIILDWIQGNKRRAATNFESVMRSVRENGDLSPPFGGGVTRSLLFTIVSARITGLWQQYKEKIQAIVNLLWSIQEPTSGGLPQKFPGGQNFFTPEPNGECLLAFDPNLPNFKP